MYDPSLLRLLLLVIIMVTAECKLKADPEGYIMFCPSMGRFGNKADLYLGSISFAAGLKRTLVLPPFGLNMALVPYDHYFRMEPIKELFGTDKVILMEEFMEELAPTVWPQEKRISFCSRYLTRGKPNDCNAKFHDHMALFWGDIEFESSVAFGSHRLGYNTRKSPDMASRWNQAYPPDQYPVLAFSSAPSRFPVESNDLDLQSLFQWADPIQTAANTFIKKHFPSTFLAVHLRIGSDFKNACNLMKEHNMKQLMASPQCLGYRSELGELTMDKCYPSDNEIINQVVNKVKQTKVDAIFVATDSRDLIDVFKEILKIKKIVKYAPSDPQVDLAILEQADYYIGNCVSSFAAFAVRVRRLHRKPVEFWGMPEKENKDEL